MTHHIVSVCVQKSIGREIPGKTISSLYVTARDVVIRRASPQILGLSLIVQKNKLIL